MDPTLPPPHTPARSRHQDSHQRGRAGHLVPGTVVVSLDETLTSLLHRAAHILVHDVGAPIPGAEREERFGCKPQAGGTGPADTDGARVKEVCSPRRRGLHKADRQEGRGRAFGEPAPFPGKRREGEAPGPKDPSESWEGLPDRSALRDATARRPGGSAARGAGEVPGTPRGPRSARPPAGGAPRGGPRGTRLRRFTSGSAVSGPAAGRGVKAGTRALGSGLGVLGAKRGAPHLLVPGAGPRGVLGLRAGLAQSRAAQGQQGQRPAPGRAGPGPRPHCARGAGSGARRVAASARACGRPGRGRRKQEARALGGAPTALRGRPLRLLAPTSPFPARGPALLRGPSMTHRSPRVPPSISLPSPKRDSPSTTTPCLQPPGLAAGGLG